ncbi:aliphatic sulfonate ABC transporter substrate-binding protein [Streptomyces sp. NPDC094448]|uniref:aliphatic sulfonate ABC transporter substrate-binding protein n=1 Tax=Streptomyces sp. NPDC094448 TaxID=3366063 RepID=UPI003816ECE7
MSPSLHPPRPRRAVAAAAVLAVLATGGCTADSADGDGTRSVDFGYIADYNQAGLLAVARERGLWKEHGIRATYKVFTDGPTQITALGAGDLDFGTIGPGAAWLPASGRATVVAVNQLGRADRVVALPGRGISRTADLKGKRVAVPEGTSGDMILGLALDRAGLSREDVKTVPMAPATAVSALASRQVDAAALWYPLLATVEKRIPGLVRLAESADFAAEFAFPSSVVAAPGAVGKDRELVEDVVRVLQKANDFRHTNPGKAIDITARFLRLDRDAVAADARNTEPLSTAELVAAGRDGTVARWFTALQGFFVRAGKLDAPVPVEKFYAGDLYQRAAAR